ncbi:MAG: diaminopimelate decarboxylase [Acidobacteria bacterium]|nr:MAG: diaminopimelate decarboxylase [Acidobacteriota bacterium]
MEHFHYVQNSLHCEGAPLAEVAARFGTPAYVYSQSTIVENFDEIKGRLAGIPSLVCYSVKANSNLKILNLLRQAGAGFDIVSRGELVRALKAGAKPDTIVFSGVGKEEAEIDAALTAGILMFNVESPGELDAIACRARHLNKQANISIRVNPDVEADTHPYISTGQFIHKFGVPKDQAVELFRRAATIPELRVRGIACHIGSQILDVNPFVKALEEILELAQLLERDGIRLEFLDLGGGYGIRYVDEDPLEIDRLMAELKKRLAGTPYRLILEPGRALVGNAGALLTRVLYIKNTGKKHFVVVDAGMNDLMRPTLYGSLHQILPVERRTESTFTADVVGPLCETGDFLARDREIPCLEPGDLVAVMTTGAYGYVLSSNYNSRPRPPEVMVSGSEVELIRHREKLEDLIAGEVF